MKFLIYLLTFSSVFTQQLIITADGKKITAKVDTSTLDSAAIYFRAIDKNFDQFLYKRIIRLIRSSNGEIIYPNLFVVNKESKKIHLESVNHLPPKSSSIFINDLQKAVKSGYVKCNACFQGYNFLPDLTTESVIRKEAILAIKNSNEILYEHSMLSKLQVILDKVLSNWPESLKGYSYRIQIIRDEQPNAYAVAGGNLYFTSGMLDMLESDAEIEAVIAHEVAHVEQRHLLRSYKAYLKKQNLLAIGSLALLLIAENQGTDQAKIASGVLAGAAAVALLFQQKGYDRELEQEADIYAQLYLNRNNKSIDPMVSALDKFLTYNIINLDYNPKINSYSSHPILTNRILQAKYGKHYFLEKPKTYRLGGRKGFDFNRINIDLEYIYHTLSSTGSTNNYEIIIAGNVFNLDKEYAFRLENVNVGFLGKNKIIKGITDSIVMSGDSMSFSGKISCTKEEKELFINDLKNNKFHIRDVFISGLKMDKKGKGMKVDKKISNLMVPASLIR